MKTITIGHKYELDNFERNIPELNQVVPFLLGAGVATLACSRFL